MYRMGFMSMSFVACHVHICGKCHILIFYHCCYYVLWHYFRFCGWLADFVSPTQLVDFAFFLFVG